MKKSDSRAIKTNKVNPTIALAHCAESLGFSTERVNPGGAWQISQVEEIELKSSGRPRQWGFPGESTRKREPRRDQQNTDQHLCMRKPSETWERTAERVMQKQCQGFSVLVRACPCISVSSSPSPTHTGREYRSPSLSTILLSVVLVNHGLKILNRKFTTHTF